MLLPFAPPAALGAVDEETWLFGGTTTTTSSYCDGGGGGGGNGLPNPKRKDRKCQSRSGGGSSSHPCWRRPLLSIVLLPLVGASVLFFVLVLPRTTKDPTAATMEDDTDWNSNVPLLGNNRSPDASSSSPSIPNITQRCDWLLSRFHQHDTWVPPSEVEKRYVTQSTDANVFYRATALIFWLDFVHHAWGAPLQAILFPQEEQKKKKKKKKKKHSSNTNDGFRDPYSTYTWVTGDQHLSNFGAWRNRHGDVVFGVNDFDEAAIYDFQVDVLRIAVSVCNHAKTNALSHKHTKRTLKAFGTLYIQTVLDYVDNDKALLFELTPDTAYGFLQNFLEDVQHDKSVPKQLAKFTVVNRTTQMRTFRKGPENVPHKDTNLAAVSPTMETILRNAFTSTRYGATMMKLGWQVHGMWDPNFFTVLDVAERIGSGVGSFGVDRYYVLLKGKDTLLKKQSQEHDSVILDVKYQPPGAVMSVLSLDETAWYHTLFANDAARVVEAQRRLTSYTDPYTGWVMLPDDQGTLQPFSVRQRSPWKDSPDLDDLTDVDDFVDFAEQIAAATATSHVRGSVAKAPGDFKHVIQNMFEHDRKKLKEWVDVLVELAFVYREQVLLDFECFQAFVKEKYPNSTTRGSNKD